MKIDFWTSTEYGGFLAELMAEMNDAGLETRQRFLISESSYRSAKSKPARLWLRLRQYAIYPIYLCGSLLWGRVKSGLKGKRKIGQGRGQLVNCQ